MKKAEPPRKPAPPARGTVLSPTPTDMQQEDVVLKGQRIYGIGPVHDFLTPSPEKLMMFSDVRLLQRVEIVHCEDATGKAKPAEAKPTAPAQPAAAPVLAKKPPAPAAKKRK